MTTTAEGLLEAMLSRRSVSSLTEPAPTDQQLHDILAAATTVPDHGSLKPWRFVVVRGSGRDEFGSALAAAAVEQDPELPPGRQDKLRNKAFLAPVLVVVIASPQPSEKVPEWEQVASASCTGYALALAAHVQGLGAVWKSANQLTGDRLTESLSLTDREQILGWVAIGTPAKDDSRPALPPSPQDHTSVLDGPTLQPFEG